MKELLKGVKKGTRYFDIPKQPEQILLVIRVAIPVKRVSDLLMKVIKHPEFKKIFPSFKKEITADNIVNEIREVGMRLPSVIDLGHYLKGTDTEIVNKSIALAKEQMRKEKRAKK